MRWRGLRLAWAAACCMAAALTTTPAAAALRAVLVGVSEYPTLQERYRLEGPRNDVRRLREVLLQRGFAASDIEVLADGIEGAALPTRDAILAAWRGAAAKAAAGDVLLFYFAGHGSQQPADRSTPEGRDEVDGLHEIILPRDVGAWSGQKSAVVNAIVDHELRQLIDRALAKGAFVWAVFDACHSATLVRSADEASSEVRYRQVAPADLGVPRTALDATIAAKPVAPARPAPKAAGGSAFFYAVQTDQLAPEMPLPLGVPSRVPHGLFSFALSRALESGQPMTYRQLAQQVLNDYGAMNEARVTPLFTGSALDQPVLNQPAPPLRQWAVSSEAGVLSLRVGGLGDVGVGSLFALVPGPLAPAGDVLGYARAQTVESARSLLTPLAFGDKPLLPAEKVPGGAYARLVQRSVSYALRVGVDGEACHGCSAGAALARLHERPPASLGVRIEWVPAGQAADVRLRLQSDAIEVLAPSQQVRTDCARPAKGGCAAAPLLGVRLKAGASPDAHVDELADMLHRIGRATNLMRLAAAQPPTPGAAASVELRMTLLRGGQRVALGAEKAALLKAGDELLVALRNPGRVPVDMTLLYADANYGVTALWPDASGGDSRLGPGDSHELSIQVTDEIVGVERIIAIAAEVQAKADRTDLSFLAQPPLTQLRGGEASANPDVQAFRDAGFADFATRGGELRRPSPRTSMQVFTVQVAR